MDLYQKIERFRRGGTVRRYHTHRLHRAPNNAEHQWGVAMLVDHIFCEASGCSSPPPKMILAALYHDVAEYDTGDMPAWVKRTTDLGDHINAIEAGVNERLDIGSLLANLSGPEKHILKCADELEHLWTCLDERRLGNTDLDEMFAGGVIRFRRWLSDTDPEYRWVPVCGSLLADLHVAYRAIGGERYIAVLRHVKATGGYFGDNNPKREEAKG